MRLFLALGLVCLALPVPTALGATASVVARVFARDGARDAVHGGPGRDEARVDRGVDRLRSVTSLF